MTLAKDAGFGNTALLSISDGAKVNVGTFNQTVGALNALGDEALSGSGQLTLGTTANGASSISGSNAFAGTVALANGHTLTLDNASGIGRKATLQFVDAKGELVLSGTNGGTFATNLVGDGTVTLSTSTNIAITGDNQSFGGQWVLTGNSSAVISDSDTLSVDKILGDGATIQLTGQNDTLTLSQAGSAWSIDETLTGAGSLTVNGTSVGQMFGFSTQWADDAEQFTGTLSIGNGLTMTVGGTDIWGANNASNLASANFNLGDNSTLIVATQDTAVDTFKAFNVNGGTIEFDGKFGLGANTNELAQLHVGSLSGAGNISLDLPDTSGTVAQTITQNGLLDINGSSLFQSLITVDSGPLSSTNGWTLNGKDVSGEGLRQRVVDDSGAPVAHAVYNYGLTVGSVNNGVNNALGIGYVLSMIDILNGKELALS